MAERKATNKYYPPQWTPNHGSLNKFHGSHPLRERASKMHLGIIGVRFELPFNIWCNGCGSHVGRGVRYNSEKSQVGKYYTTPIFKFRMKCHLCDNYFEIQTDPQNSDYVVTSGASRKNERWDNVEGETVSLEGKMEKEKLDNDPMFKLEHSIQDEEIGKDETPRIQLLQDMQEDKRNDFSLNQLLRKRFRDEKKEIKKEEEKDIELQRKASISIPLVAEVDEDVSIAKRVHYSSRDADRARVMKRRLIKSQSVFGDRRRPLTAARLRMSLAASSGSHDTKGSSTIKQQQQQLVIHHKNNKKINV